MIKDKLLICFCILFITAVICIGDIYADEAVMTDIITSKIDIPEGYTVISSAASDGNISKFWWRTPADTENGGEISVTADEKGNILSYYHFKNDYVSKDEGAHFSVYNKSDSRFFALRFIEKVCPELADKVEYNTGSLESDISRSMKTSSVSFYRIENNIPYYDNYMEFIIDLNTSEVIQYTLNWDFEVIFPDVSEVISQQEALRQYNSRIGIGLKYKLKIEENEKTAYLVYSPNGENILINAENGRIFNEIPLIDNNVYFTAFSDETKPEIISLTQQEAQEVNSNQLDIASAEEYVRSIQELEIADDYHLTFSSYEKINDKYCINLEFSRVPDIAFEEMTEQEKLMYLAGDYSYIRVKTDINTKDIIYMRCYNKEAASDKKIVTDTIAKLEADKFLKNYLSSKYENSLFSSAMSVMNDNIYKMVYICSVGNIPFYGNRIIIQYDCGTGKFISLDCNWFYDVSFESSADILTEDTARDIFFSKISLQLIYITTNEGIKAVYMLNPFYPHSIGAKDGELKNNDGSNFKARKYNDYEDIEGHYAQGIIMRLNNNLIISSESERYFKPDINISQKDFLLWMTAALTGINYQNDKELYNYLSLKHIITAPNIYPEAEILKEDAIVLFIRALGYESLAQAKDIYKLDFADNAVIGADKIGYIALAKGIGMIDGDENNRLNPKTPLTRSEACCMIYKYLAR